MQLVEDRDYYKLKDFLEYSNNAFRHYCFKTIRKRIEVR